MRWRLWVSALVVLAGFVAVPAAASASVPDGFVGMMADGPFFYPGMNEGTELSSMVSSGVESVRTVVNWSSMQPVASEQALVKAKIPTANFTKVNGVPTDFASLDLLVAAAAERRLTVLPVVEYAPPWDSLNPRSAASPPKSPQPFARFVAALARRYGPHGSFWSAHPTIPRVPIRTWEIWNEPNFKEYWSQQPFEPGYVRLLRAVRPVLRKADPSAKILVAGLANFSWQYLADMYKLGARPFFDAVAVHPYTATPAGVITILGKVRAVMNRHGDRKKPILATEVSWPSAKGKAPTTFENATTEQGQARKVAQAVRLLAANRRRLKLSAFYYYTWIGNETMPGARADQFNFAGLLQFFDGKGPRPKPALAAFTKAALAIEGCRSKGPLATDCVR